MCNEAARRISLGEIRDDWSQLKIPLRFPEGLPNLPATDSIRITDPAAIIRPAAGDPDAAELVQRRWSWPGPGGRPVFNFRSENRRFPAASRCLIPLDGFYEFTDPEPGAKPRRKAKWRFTLPGRGLFCIAGLWRADPAVGEAFTMLTCAPGPDIAPIHDRQVVVMPRAHWAAWLAGADGLIAPTPAGTFEVTPA